MEKSDQVCTAEQIKEGFLIPFKILREALTDPMFWGIFLGCTVVITSLIFICSGFVYVFRFIF